MVEIKKSLSACIHDHLAKATKVSCSLVLLVFSPPTNPITSPPFRLFSRVQLSVLQKQPIWGIISQMQFSSARLWLGNIKLNFHFLTAAIATVRNYPESYTTLQTLVVNLVQNQNTRCSFWLLATCESEARLAGEWQSMKSRALNQPVNFQFSISMSRKTTLQERRSWILEGYD